MPRLRRRSDLTQFGVLATAALLASSCASGPCETRISGGTAESRSLALDALTDVLSVVEHPVCIRRVDLVDRVRLARSDERARVIHELGASVNGLIRSGQRQSRMELQADLSETEARRVLAHEVCHAIAAQHHEEDSWPALPSSGPFADDVDEAFARWCDDGFLGTRLVSLADDLPGVHRAPSALAASQWVEPGWLEGSKQAARVELVRIDALPDVLYFAGFTHDGHVVLETWDEDRVVIDVETFQAGRSQVEVVERRTVAPPSWQAGLEGWQAGVTWQAYDGGLVGTVFTRLPDDTPVSALVGSGPDFDFPWEVLRVGQHEWEPVVSAAPEAGGLVVRVWELW